MGRATVLICDDNAAVHESLASYLREEEIAVISVYDGETALQRLLAGGIDLAILDIMLPGISGIDVCREVRAVSKVPIIMLSAKGEEHDVIIGLKLGADDYVTKPFSPREVVTRVNTIFRRLSPIIEDKKLFLQELTIIPDAYEVYVSDKKIDLTPKETEILIYLVKNTGKVLSRDQILSAIWGYEYFGDTRAVDTQIKRIRQKLPTATHFAIRSIYGVGYKLEETK